MGSKRVDPQYYLPPDLKGIRSKQISFFDSLFNQYGTGNNPFYQGYGGFDLNSILQGRGTGAPGAIGAAGRTLQQAIETGLPIDTTPIIRQAREAWAQDIAPEIQEQLGARYGMKFGTPVAESLSRSGQRATTDLNAILAGYAEQSQQRRLGASNMAFQLAEMERMGRQNAQQQFLHSLMGGPQALYGQGQWMMPQYKRNPMVDLASSAATMMAAMYGGPAGAAAVQGLTNTMAPQSDGGYMPQPDAQGYWGYNPPNLARNS